MHNHDDQCRQDGIQAWVGAPNGADPDVSYCCANNSTLPVRLVG